jgi:acetyl esterase/lipase
MYTHPRTKVLCFMIGSLFTLGLLISACGTGQASPTIPPTPQPTPAPTFDPGKYNSSDLDVTYCTMGDAPQKMDIYYPASGGPWPALIYVHGGSWVEGDKAEGEGWRYLNDQGFLVASVNYRLTMGTTKFPAMIEDVKCAVRYLRAHAAEYNLDANHIGALGASAGGHLVSLLGTSDPSAGWDVGEYLDQSSRVQAVVPISGFSDFTIKVFDEIDIYVMYAMGDLSGKSTEKTIAASPVTYITADDPPFLIIHGDNDGVAPVEQATVLQGRLEAAGVPSELIIVQNGSHSLTEADMVPTREEISQSILDFLVKNLK